MAESAKPPSGGNVKYIVGGVVLLLLAVGLWFNLRSPAHAPAPPAPPPPPPPAAERVNPMAQPELILEEEKDAGKPAAPAAATDKDKPKRAPREARGEWDCEGDLARAALQSVIDGNRSQIRSCYERRLKTNNVLAGDLTLKIRVAPNGKVDATAISGTLRDNEVFGCVRAIASKWTFPPPHDGCAVVQVPFQFSPKSN